MARRKVTVRDIGEILDHWQSGRGIRAVARSLGVSRPTVRKYVALATSHGYVIGGLPPPEGWRVFLEQAAPELVDPTAGSVVFRELLEYHDMIREALEKTTVAVGWQRLRDEHGLGASYSSFYRYVRKCLPEVLERQGLTVRREDPPAGEEAQVDYGYLGLWEDPVAGRKRRLWAFVMVLSHSRHMFVRVVERMDQASWLECHVRSFEFWGGTPRRVVLDNLTSGVIKADLYDPKFNRGYSELASHYGVLIDPARVQKPKDKPRVERMMPFVRGSLWAGRSFGSLDEINRQADQWCVKVAGMRVHGTTRQRPLEVFQGLERQALRPLPPEPFEVVTWVEAKLGRDCYFYAGGGGYTAPHPYACRKLMVRLTARRVEAYWGYDLIKTHPRVPKGKRSTDWNDFPPKSAAFFQRTPDWCRKQAQELGEAVHQAVEALLEDHALYHLRQVHGILRLAEKYGPQRLNAACSRALNFGDPTYRTIKNILESGRDKLVALQTHRVETGAYLRGAAELVEPLASKARS
jgi:transposase